MPRQAFAKFVTFSAAVALAVPPLSLPVSAQERINREQVIRICTELLQTDERVALARCAVEQFEARGQEDAAQAAREVLREAQAAQQADTDAQARQQEAAERARQLEAQAQDRSAEQGRQDEQAAARAAREAERAQAEAEREAARQAAEQARAESRQREDEVRQLSRQEAIQTCADETNSTDRQTVGACVVEKLAADGQRDLAIEIREALAEERRAAEDQAAAAQEARRQAEAQAATRQSREGVALTREAARDACFDELPESNRTRTAMRRCIADKFEANGQAAAAEQVRESLPDSQVAEEVASRGEPELTEAQRRAQQLTERALAREERRAAAEAARAEARGQVTERRVTEQDARRSDEEFRTEAVVSDNDDDGGLSTPQKLALGALGALAVGTLLNNRDRVVSNSGDRVVVQQDDGELQILKDDDALLARPGNDVRTETFDDGSTRQTVIRADGSQVVTIRDASLRVLRRTLIEPNGVEYVLIDDTADVAPVDVGSLPPVTVGTTRDGAGFGSNDPLDPLGTLGGGLAAASGDPLRDALRREAGYDVVDRRFSLNQVREIPEVRALAPAVEVADVTFASGSAAIQPEEARALTELAREVLATIQANPREVFLVEGHTDAVGDAAYNLALSDRRAESLALALNEYFDVPVENLVVQGYGERFLKVPTTEAERANRRATLRRITPLLQTAAAN